MTTAYMPHSSYNAKKTRVIDHHSEICFERILKFMRLPLSRRLKHEKINGSKH